MFNYKNIPKQEASETPVKRPKLKYHCENVWEVVSYKEDHAVSERKLYGDPFSKPSFEISKQVLENKPPYQYTSTNVEINLITEPKYTDKF